MVRSMDDLIVESLRSRVNVSKPVKDFMRATFGDEATQVLGFESSEPVDDVEMTDA